MILGKSYRLSGLEALVMMKIQLVSESLPEAEREDPEADGRWPQ